VRRFTLADGLVFTTVMIWALNVIVVKLLLGHFEPLALAVVRFVLTTSVFAFIVPLREGSISVSRRHLPLLLGAGLCGIWLNQVAFVYGLENATAATITLLLTTIPVFAGIGSMVLGWERPGWRHWTGIVVGFAGVALIVLSTPQTSGHTSNLLGDFLGLVTAASWAAYSLMLRPLMLAYSPFRISLYVAAIGLVALLPLGLPQFAGSHLAALSIGDWGLVLYSSLGAIVLTNVFWYTGIHRLGPARTTVYSYLQPVAGVVFALIILNEPLALLQLAGGAIVLGGVIFGRERNPEPARAE
jgi:drug/metabolite transporter (DMT)-like permease